MDDTFDFVFAIYDREMSEAGFIELIKDKGAENLSIFNENHAGLRHHEVFDFAVVKAHNSGDTSSIGVG